jgi:hypothetical protein
MFVVCLVFAGLFQLSQVFVANEVLNRATQCAIRARTVGFNQWMVEKCTRVACIPNAGLLTYPDFTDPTPDIEPLVRTLKPGTLWDTVLKITPVSDQTAFELARIPEYLASEDPGNAAAILDYADWNSVDVPPSPPPVIIDPDVKAGMLETTVRQVFRLRIPLHRAYYGADSVLLSGKTEMESHYSLYLDDYGW